MVMSPSKRFCRTIWTSRKIWLSLEIDWKISEASVPKKKVNLSSNQIIYGPSNSWYTRESETLWNVARSVVLMIISMLDVICRVWSSKCMGYQKRIVIPYSESKCMALDGITSAIEPATNVKCGWRHITMSKCIEWNKQWFGNKIAGHATRV